MFSGGDNFIKHKGSPDKVAKCLDKQSEFLWAVFLNATKHCNIE